MIEIKTIEKQKKRRFSKGINGSGSRITLYWFFFPFHWFVLRHLLIIKNIRE